MSRLGTERISLGSWTFFRIDYWLLTERMRPEVLTYFRCFIYTGLNGLLSIFIAMLFIITAFVKIPSRLIFLVVCSSGEMVAELGMKQP